MSTPLDSKSMVLAYIKINPGQAYSTIAVALGLEPLVVSLALLAIKRDSRAAAFDKLAATGDLIVTITRVLNAAEAQGEVMHDTPQGRVRVEYASGLYTITL